jgi:hypothetical protein
MIDISPENVANIRHLQELLLDYLLHASAPAWPGADGLTIEEVLEYYPEAASCGSVPNEEELICRHGDIRKELVDFFERENRRLHERETCH